VCAEGADKSAGRRRRDAQRMCDLVLVESKHCARNGRRTGTAEYRSRMKAAALQAASDARRTATA